MNYILLAKAAQTSMVRQVSASSLLARERREPQRAPNPAECLTGVPWLQSSALRPYLCKNNGGKVKTVEKRKVNVA
jgi:hypothetical protein